MGKLISWVLDNAAEIVVAWGIIGEAASFIARHTDTDRDDRAVAKVKVIVNDLFSVIGRLSPTFSDLKKK